MELTPLGFESIEALTEFAREPGVARFSDHLELASSFAWATWLGDADPNRATTLAVREGGRLCAVARLTTTSRRRRVHVGTVEVLAPWQGGDDAVDLALGALVRSADAWLQLSRLELVAPAGHPRVEGVYAAHGFELENTMKDSIRRDGSYADEVGLARIRPGFVSPEPLEGPPVAPPRKRGPSNLEIRSLRPEDAEAWTATLSDPGVVWGTLQLPHQRSEWWAARIRDDDPARVWVLGADVGGVIVAGAALVLKPAPRRRHCASLGMHVSTKLQGRGIGRRLMNEALALADSVGIHRVELEVYADNPRALALYESAGFVHEGRRRMTCFRDGALVDDLMMSRLATG